MTLEELKRHANTAKKAATNISEASPEEISSLFACPDLLLTAIRKIEETKGDLYSLID